MSYQQTFSLDDVGKAVQTALYSFGHRNTWRPVLVNVLMVVTSTRGTIALFRPKRKFVSKNHNMFNEQAKAIRAFMKQ